MAKRANSKTATQSPKAAAKKKGMTLTGVQKAIAYLVANEKHIGALVLCAAPHAAKRLPSINGEIGQLDGVWIAADAVTSKRPEDLETTTNRTFLTKGLSTFLADRVAG